VNVIGFNSESLQFNRCSKS